MKISQMSPAFAVFTVLFLLISGCSGTVVKDSPAPAGSPLKAKPIQGENSTLTTQPAQPATVNIKLPEPRLKSSVSLEEALYSRRSIRQYADSPLTLSDVSQLLWAAQGITDSTGKRTAPSAQRLYPLEVYIVAGNVENLTPGIYLYSPEGHELVKIKDGDFRSELGGRPDSQKAPIDIVMVGNYSKVPEKFGTEGAKWVHLECGHAAQNICLQATALNLGTVTAAGFQEDKLKSLLGLSAGKGILYLMPVGKKT